jgi:glycosyltransferase involved in cell wall biosynthesis
MVTTHPIQYQVPWLRMLGDRDDIDLHVYFAMLPTSQEQGREFGVAFDWDTPLLDGYRYTVLKNESVQPGLTAWSGCDTPAIYAALRDGKFDAVIVNGWGSKTAVQALIACRRLRIPCIVRGEANGLRQRNWAKRLGHRALLSQYSAFLAIGQHNRRYYESLGVSKSLIFDTPYCVDNHRFAVAADEVRRRTERIELRSSFGLDPQAMAFLFSGKFVDKKHPADAIEAIGKLLASDGPAVQLLMVGDGPLRSQLEQAAAGLPIRFAGFLNQSQMALAYAASDCLVLPSDAGETWGLVVNEAMACGLPAIVSDQVGCAFDLVIAGTTGQIYRCRDVSALAARMQEFAVNSARCAELGLAARRHVESRFNFDGVVDGVLRALSAVKQ